MRLISGRKPMSSIRSASSSTRISTRERLTVFCSKWSRSRPGVAIRISTPPRTTTDASGARKLDEAGWEAAIQKVLAACKEFNVACGYPASANDIEMRMKQGFSVFVMNWGDPGFKAIEIGKKASGR